MLQCTFFRDKSMPKLHPSLSMLASRFSIDQQVALMIMLNHW